MAFGPELRDIPPASAATFSDHQRQANLNCRVSRRERRAPYPAGNHEVSLCERRCSRFCAKDFPAAALSHSANGV